MMNVMILVFTGLPVGPYSGIAMLLQFFQAGIVLVVFVVEAMIYSCM